MSDFERTIGFGDMYGTRASVRVYEAESDDESAPGIQFAVETGISGGRGYPTAEAARQIAAALLDAADRAERQAA